MSWPDRWDGVLEESLDLCSIGTLTFEHPDREVFRCLDLAFAALRAGGDAPATLNAANEVAVEAFLEGRIGFLDIGRVIEAVLVQEPPGRLESLEQLLETDRRARALAQTVIGKEIAAR